MVLESLINPFQARKRPVEMIFMGALYSSVALFLSNWIFREQASLIMVFLTVMSALPFVYTTIKESEKSDPEITNPKSLIKEHAVAIKLFTYLFVGFVLALVFWYSILPTEIIQDTFRAQSLTIQSINLKISGGFASVRTFNQILLNNLKVLVFCLMFAFLFGAGAIFILTWNATVISTAIGNFIRTNLASITDQWGFTKVASYLQIVSLGLLRYMLHGIPEIVAYFVAGLAGSIISVAVIQEKFGTRRFEKIILDSSSLVLIAILILIVAAVIEVYITPLLF